MSRLINATIAAIVYLVYIGAKPQKTDTVTDTKITWRGFGDKQPVPADKASILLGHPDVWVTEEEFQNGVASGKYRAPEGPPITVQADPGASDIDLDNLGNDDDENEGESDSSVIAKIQEYILSIETDKKPKIDTVRAALPDLKITAADLTKAWKELGAPDEDEA